MVQTSKLLTVVQCIQSFLDTAYIALKYTSSRSSASITGCK